MMKEFRFTKGWAGAGVLLAVLMLAVCYAAPLMAADANDAAPVAVSVAHGDADCAAETFLPFPDFKSINAHSGVMPDCTHTADGFAPGVDSADSLDTLTAGHNFWPGSMSHVDRIDGEPMASPSDHWGGDTSTDPGLNVARWSGGSSSG